MRYVVLMFAAMMALAPLTIQASAGNCDYSYQRDKNGNACGDRAADRRDGGR